MEDIRITPDYQLRATIPGSWGLYAKVDVGGYPEWQLRGTYRTVKAAVTDVLDVAVREGLPNVAVDLAGALDVMRRIERDVARHAERFERAVGAPEYRDEVDVDGTALE